MPVKIIKQENGKYMVTTPNGVKGRNMTLKNAQAQKRLLDAVDHGFRPTKKKKGLLEKK